MQSGLRPTSHRERTDSTRQQSGMLKKYNNVESKTKNLEQNEVALFEMPGEWRDAPFPSELMRRKRPAGMNKINCTVTADYRMVKNRWLIVKAAGSGFTGDASRFQMPFVTLVMNRAGSVVL